MRLYIVLAFAAATASAQSCFDQDPYWNEYELDTEMSGATFFDHWDFSTTDYNVGAADYLDRNASIAAGVVEATDDYAILRVGAPDLTTPQQFVLCFMDAVLLGFALLAAWRRCRPQPHLLHLHSHPQPPMEPMAV